MRPVRIWDGPTRLFKWGLVTAVAVSWMTGGDEDRFLIHLISGYAIGLLLLFRVVWGFLGGEHARFADFVRSPAVALAGAKAVLAGKAEKPVGHTAAGGWMILALLTTLALTVLTGLASGEDGIGGPLWPLLGGEGLAEIHEVLVNVLLALVAVHVFAVFYIGSMVRQGLVSAMMLGWKEADDLPPGTPDAKPAPPGALAKALAIVGAVALLAFALTDFKALTTVAPEAQERHEGGQDDRDDD